MHDLKSVAEYQILLTLSSRNVFAFKSKKFLSLSKMVTLDSVGVKFFIVGEGILRHRLFPPAHVA